MSDALSLVETGATVLALGVVSITQLKVLLSLPKRVKALEDAVSMLAGAIQRLDSALERLSRKDGE